jgi:urease accessory protein
VRAAARVEVARRGGRDVLVDLRSEPPLTLRATPGRVLVVGSAAAPVGGDDLRLDVVVGPSSRLALGSAAATLAWPGAHGEWSAQRTTAIVGTGGHLCWAPEPLVAVAGCRHRTTMTVCLDTEATAWVLEEISLGRSGEVSGRVDLEWRVERGGAPLVHHAERLGPEVPGWNSLAAAGTYRHLAALLVIGCPATELPATVVGSDLAVAHLALAEDAYVVLAAGVDRPHVTAALPPPHREVRPRQPR